MKQLANLLAISCFMFAGCATKVYYSPQAREWKQSAASVPASHTLYLIGDAGSPKLNYTEPNLRLLKSQLTEDSSGTVVFLGDNIYNNGLHPPGHPKRPKEEQKLTEQLKVLENHRGKVVFIPGNHDWDDMKEDGLKHVREQEQFVEEYLQRGNTFLPDNGCPGPVAVELSPELVLIVYDSQWWLHTHEKPYGPGSGCTAADEKAFLKQMRDLIEGNRHRNVVVAAHHPLMSNSKSEGYFSIAEHLFPISLVKSKWYIPLPVIGSLYPFYRQLGGVEQDIPHPRYRLLRDELYKIFRHHDHLVYASGHDHNMQFHRSGKLTHILSGAGCKTNYVAPHKRAEFVQQQKGYARVLYYPNHEVWVEYWKPEAKGHTGTLMYRTRLYTRQPKADHYCTANEADLPIAAVSEAAAPKAGPPPSGLSHWLYGKHYTREWITPVQVPVLNLQNAYGGLTPVATSGPDYRQALSLVDSAGHEYEFQSLRRHPIKAVPPAYRDLPSLSAATRKRVALQHPFAPQVAASLAQKAGVLHRMPGLAKLPDSDCLGPYRQSYAHVTGYLQRKAHDLHFEQLPGQGQPVKVLEYQSLLNALDENPFHAVDERELARARLLDMLMGDWDQHEQQYQWVAVPRQNGSLLFKPLPTDRDNAFYRFEGLVPWLLSQPWALRDLQHFGHRIRDIKGLNNTARTLDRRHLTSLTLSDWRAIADSLKHSLTDQNIDQAVESMPAEIYSISGADIAGKLKSRREQLPQVAETYYKLLARYVDIYGSDENEYFEIDRLNDQQTQITVYALDSSGVIKKALYRRVFHSTETKEIRLYGLGGNDVFNTTGMQSGKILVRLIGGRGYDQVNQAEAPERARGIAVFDQDADPNVLDYSAETSIDFSSGELIANPGADQFFYHYLGPKIDYRYNPDDGLMPGAGLVLRTYKFRSYPYGSEHRLLYHYGFGNKSGRVSYQGDFRNAIGRLDVVVNAWAYTPHYVFNYFGYGNNSHSGQDTGNKSNQVRMRHMLFRGLARKTFATFITVGAGPKYELFGLSKNNPELINSELNPDDKTYSTRQYLGAAGFAEIGIRNNIHNPTRGVLMRVEANLNKQLGLTASNYRQYHSQVLYYLSPDISQQLTFAGRLGGTVTTGSYSFYQAAMLGGGTLPDMQQNLRGFPKTRFIGDRSLFTNLELRASVLHLRLYLLPVKAGVLGLYDTGRVWATEEQSQTWHKAYGGGIWMSLVNRITMSATLARSREGNFINIQNGFFF